MAKTKTATESRSDEPSASARRRASRGCRRRWRPQSTRRSTRRRIDVVVLDLRKAGGFTDYFVICTGDNARQINAIADAVRGDAARRTSASGRRWPKAWRSRSGSCSTTSTSSCTSSAGSAARSTGSSASGATPSGTNSRTRRSAPQARHRRPGRGPPGAALRRVRAGPRYPARRSGVPGVLGHCPSFPAAALRDLWRPPSFVARHQPGDVAVRTLPPFSSHRAA